MSHFTLMVIGPETKEEIDAALAPFDENMEVEPYRSYEKGDAEDYWFVRSVRRDAQHFREGTGLEEGDLRNPMWGKDPLTPDEKRAEYEEQAELEKSFSTPATWGEVASAYNAKYGDEDGDRLLVDDDGRAYTMSTYNPLSKWDWYEVGGRWAGYLRVKPGAETELNFSWGWKEVPEDERPGKGRADRAQLKDIDFEAWRKEYADAANAKYDQYEKFKAEHGMPPKWDHDEVDARIKAGESIDEIRKAYHSNPLVQLMKKEFEETLGWGADLWREFGGLDREVYVNRAVNRVAVCYATLNNGEWIAPGHMGMFGMSSDDEDSSREYEARISELLDELDPETWITVMDLHI